MPEENPFIALRFPNRPPPENPNLPLTPPVDETLPAAVAAEETEVQVAVGNDPNTGAPITEESSLLEDIVDVGVTGPVRGIYQGLDAASDLLQSGVDALGIPSHLIRNRDDGSIELLTSEEVEDRGGDPQNTLLQRAVDANVPQTIGGNLTAGLAQVVTSLLAGGSITGPLRVAAAASGATRAAHTVGTVTLSDLIGFHGDDASISQLVADNTELSGAVIDYLADRSEGDTGENRFKNALEGFGIGMAAATVFRVFRFVKGMRRAGEGGGDDAGGAAQRYLDENRAELEDIADDLEVLQADPNFLRNAVSSPVGSAASRAVSTDSPEALARAGADADDAAVATLRARAVTPEAPTPAAFDPVRPVVDTDAVEAGLIRLDADPNYVDEFVPSPLNHARMDTPEEVQQGVRAIGEAVRPQIEALVGTGTQTFDSLRVAAAERLADATGLGLDTIVASARRAAASAQEQAEILIASEQAMLSVTREARKVSRLVVEGRATDVDRARLQLLAQQSGDLLASHKAIGTGAARTTSAGRISAADTLDTVQLNNAYVRDAISRGDVDILAEQIHSMAGKVGAITRVLNKPPSLLRKFTEFYVNARLSNPATHLLNFVSTATHTIALPMEQIIGGGVRFLGGGGASAARDMREGLLEFWYMKESMQEGWQSIGQSFRTSQSVLDTNTKLDEVYSKIAITSDSQSVWGSGMRGFGNLVRIPTRLLTTGDEIFKQVAYRANLKARSHIEAGELFGGDVVARNDYVQRKLAEGFDPNTGRALDADALQRAREATFTTPLDEGRAFVDIARALQGAVRVAPPLRFVAPFIRTPANLIRQAIMRTPALGLLHKEMLADIAAGGVRRSRAIGKQTMGLSVVAGTLFAVQNGRFTGSGPSDPAQRADLMRAGWRPLSFVYTDNDGVKQYVEMGRADPVSTLIGLTADAYYLAPYLEEGDYSEIMMGLAASFTQNIANKAYLSGLAGAMEAFNSPDRQFERFFGNLVGGFAPAGARPISAAVGLDPDPYIREVRGILDRLKSQIPGWSTTLPAQRDWLTGNPRQYPEGYLWGDRSLAPFPRTSRSENDVVNELARIPHGFRGPPRQIQGVDLSPQQHDRWEELHGTIEIGGLTLLERLDQEIRTEDYDLDRNVYPDVGGDASSNRRVAILSPWIEAYREEAAYRLREEEEDLDQEILRAQQVRGGMIMGDSAEPEILRDIREALSRSQNPLPFN